MLLTNQVLPKRIPLQMRSTFAGLMLAVLSGVLLGLAFPPLDFSWLIWMALVPLLWATMHAPGARVAFAYGLTTAVIFYLITTYPLTSAHSWSGWQSVASETEQTALITQQKRKLFTLWILWPFWAGLFWGISTALLQKLHKTGHWRIAVFAPPIFIFLTEWLRSKTSYNHHWSFLGNAAIDMPGVIQLSALGGVWLISWLVILVNIALLALIPSASRKDWKLAGFIASLFLAVILLGSWQARQIEQVPAGADQLRVAAIQHHHDAYTPEDYSAIGIEIDFLDLMLQVSSGAIGHIDILVLPESIAFAALSIDGTYVEGLPREIQQPLSDWTDSITWIISQGQADLVIALGAETVEGGELYNSMTFWTMEGLEHVYHKRELVPLAEYQPEMLKFFAFSGDVHFSAGKQSTAANIRGQRLGTFICQEVLTPAVIHDSVRNGAEILISGGNDGVFANPAIAEVHAKLARIRAVESGRYIVRAMKTGISAIISPSGRELSRSPSSDAYVVVAQIRRMEHLTFYMRTGNWPIGLALLLVLIGIAEITRLRKSQPGKSPG